jgi:hypothetical protein
MVANGVILPGLTIGRGTYWRRISGYEKRRALVHMRRQSSPFHQGAA